ncbi:MAG: malate dehydrogenase [Porphyromonas sp.]|nr:malate dehydrogenase [Bacteroidales bacterium]MDY3100365.1 malate dehydrogenase [Porphyromonas sp.]
MNFVTQDKLVIVGAAGMIGSNMAQTAAMMHLTPNICLFDVYLPGLEGVVEELRHCGFDGLNITYTDKVEEAFKDAKYIVSSGGAPRKEGMTREDLVAGNSKIAAELGDNIKKYCPDVKHVTIIFNPADITGLVCLIHAGIEPSRLTTLAALDSTRLQSELAKHFGVLQHEVTGCRTYGGHGEQMAVFAGDAKVGSTPLKNLIGSDKLTDEEWAALRQRVIKGGANIIKLRGRSSFQSPAYLSIEMIGAAMGGEPFRWPAGVYVHTDRYRNIMMAYETEITKNGAVLKELKGSDKEMAELDASYKHLTDLRDQVIGMGVIPPVAEWHKMNPHLK